LKASHIHAAAVVAKVHRAGRGTGIRLLTNTTRESVVRISLLPEVPCALVLEFSTGWESSDLGLSLLEALLPRSGVVQKQLWASMD
jgi:hypothetical protein